MNNFELAVKCKDIALNHKTLYVLGGIGYRLDSAGKQRAYNAYAYNAKADRKRKIEAASADTWAFDCVCLIKSLLYGWSGDKTKTNGGAIYGSNSVPDVGADMMIGYCSNVSKDFSCIEIGEAVWMSGHIGVYIGNGLAVECTPIWRDGVQITSCNCTKVGYNRRDWTKHGQLPWVKYVPLGDIDFDGDVDTADARTALRGAIGLEKLTDAKIMAADLNGNGEIDTADARRILRKSIGLEDKNG